jgi:hypothetical protein
MCGHQVSSDGAIRTGDETCIHHYKHKADAMEAPVLSCHKKIQDSDITWEANVDRSFGTLKVLSFNISLNVESQHQVESIPT